MDNRSDDSVADRDIRSFFARLAQRKDPCGKRPKRVLVLFDPGEELFHRLRIGGHT